MPRYGYGYGYGYGVRKKDSIPKYIPYLNYKWNTITENGIRYLQDSGTTPKLHGEMFTGRGLQFDSALSQSVIANKLSNLDINTGLTISLDIAGAAASTNLPLFWLGRYDMTIFDSRVNIYNGVSHNYFHNWTGYYKLTIVCDSVSTFLYKDSELVHTFEGVLPTYVNQVLEIGGRSAYGATTDKLLSNLIILNQSLTPTQVQAQYNNPESFLWRDSNGDLQSDTIDTNNVISWFPMIDTDGYVRDNAGYSESEVFSEDFSDISEWTTTTSTFELDNGTAYCVRNEEGIANITLDTPSKTDTYYLITYDISDMSNATSGYAYILFGGVITEQPRGNGSFSHIVKSVGVANVLGIKAGGVAGLTFNIDNLEITELSGIYPINNYTEQMNVSQLNTGLQTSKLLIENNVVSGLATGIKGHGDGYVDTGWIPSADEDWMIECVFEVVHDGLQHFFGTSWVQDKVVILKHIDESVLTYIGDKSISVGIVPEGFVHLCVKYDGTEFSIYLNGVYKGLSSGLTFNNHLNTFILLSRGTNDGKFLKGEQTLFKIHTEPQDPVELYNKAKTDLAKEGVILP